MVERERQAARRLEVRLAGRAQSGSLEPLADRGGRRSRRSRIAAVRAVAVDPVLGDPLAELGSATPGVRWSGPSRAGRWPRGGAADCRPTRAGRRSAPRRSTATSSPICPAERLIVRARLLLRRVVDLAAPEVVVLRREPVAPGLLALLGGLVERPPARAGRAGRPRRRAARGQVHQRWNSHHIDLSSRRCQPSSWASSQRGLLLRRPVRRVGRDTSAGEARRPAPRPGPALGQVGGQRRPRGPPAAGRRARSRRPARSRSVSSQSRSRRLLTTSSRL